MLTQWLSGVDSEPSWNDIIKALHNPAVNYPALAEEIKQKHCNIKLDGSHTAIIRKSVTTQESRGSYLTTVTSLRSYPVKELLPKFTQIPTLHSRYQWRRVKISVKLIESFKTITCTDQSSIIYSV